MPLGPGEMVDEEGGEEGEKELVVLFVGAEANTPAPEFVSSSAEDENPCVEVGEVADEEGGGTLSAASRSACESACASGRHDANNALPIWGEQINLSGASCLLRFRFFFFFCSLLFAFFFCFYAVQGAKV
jgi:hypothetical protein